MKDVLRWLERHGKREWRGAGFLRTGPTASRLASSGRSRKGSGVTTRSRRSSGRATGMRPGCSRRSRTIRRGDGRADGGLGRRVRPLSDLRHGLLPPLRPDAARLVTGEGLGRRLWGLTVHDREAADRTYLACLPLIDKAALDERELVKRGVDMALRALGKRNATLRRAAVDVADSSPARPRYQPPGSGGARSASCPAAETGRRRLAEPAGPSGPRARGAIATSPTQSTGRGPQATGAASLSHSESVWGCYCTPRGGAPRPGTRGASSSCSMMRAEGRPRG